MNITQLKKKRTSIIYEMKYPSSLVYFTLSKALVFSAQNFFNTESLKPQSLRFC